MAWLVLVAWTLFVWGGRLRNLIRGDEDAPVSFVLAVVFCVLATAVVGSWFLARRRHRVVVVALAGVTAAVWAVRGVQIALADHELGFIAVHTVLALVSIGLAGFAWWHGRPEHTSPSVA